MYLSDDLQLLQNQTMFIEWFLKIATTQENYKYKPLLQKSNYCNFFKKSKILQSVVSVRSFLNAAGNQLNS